MPPAATTIPARTSTALQDEMKHYLDLGYSCVKMKIGGVPLADDIKRIEAVLKIVGAGDRLAVDVNGTLRPRRRRSPSARRSRPMACAGTRSRSIRSTIWRMRRSPTRYAPPLATGENLFSMQDARNLIRHGGLRPDRDILQFDPALSYGLVEYLRTLDMLKAQRLVAAALRAAWRPSVRAQHRGRPAAAAATNPIRRCSRRSAASPTIAPVDDSRVALPDVPGIGFEAKNELYAVMKPLAELEPLAPAKAGTQSRRFLPSIVALGSRLRGN